VPGIVASRDELLPFVGPPFALPLWSAISQLPWAAAVAVWIGVVIVAIATLVFAGLRLARTRVDALDVVAACAFAAGFGPLTSAAALGQAALPACAAIAVAPMLLGRRFVFAACIAALVAALQPNLSLVLAALLNVRRASIALVGAAFIVVLGSALALAGNGGFAHYLDVLRAHAAAERFIAIQTTVAAVVRGLGGAPALASVTAVVVAVAVAVVVATQWFSRRYDAGARVALASAALPMALPFAHEHDFTIAFLPAFMVVRRACGATWVVATCAALAVAVDWLGLAQRPSGALETAALTLAAALAAATLGPKTVRMPWRFAPCVVVLVVILVARLAAAHPLPTWPDALPRDFHVPVTMPAPDVWRLEQERSGIGGLDPVWALLRLTSLSACAVLWFAAARSLVLPRGDDRKAASA